MKHPLNHGFARYVFRGCSCPECHKAFRAYIREHPWLEKDARNIRKQVLAGTYKQ